MMNGSEINAEIGSSDGQERGRRWTWSLMREAARPSERTIYNELFLMTVSRHPTTRRSRQLEEVRNGGAPDRHLACPARSEEREGPATAQGTAAWSVPGRAADDVTFYQDVFWALLNSNEFMLNH